MADRLRVLTLGNGWVAQVEDLGAEAVEGDGLFKDYDVIFCPDERKLFASDKPVFYTLTDLYDYGVANGHFDSPTWL